MAEIARSASEREIETEVVQVLKLAGWPRSQINQDVPISDKGADKADIVLKLDNQPVILVEVKKYGQSRDAENQVNRYCRLLRPSPKLALLTDGVRWVLYYVGHAGAIPIQEAAVPKETASVEFMLTAFNPTSLSSSLHTGVFDYLDIVEQGLQGRSEDTQKRLRPYFASTVKSLLMPGEKVGIGLLPTEVSPRRNPVQAKKHPDGADVAITQVKQKGAEGEYDPSLPPSLSFTTVVTASFANVTATNWGDLLRAAVKSALEAGLAKQDIQRLTSINILEGAVTDRGYSPFVGTNVSIQGQSADESWQNALKLAKRLECVIEARFRWRDNEKASHPGESGILRWSP